MYWHWGLTIANQWRERMGLHPEPSWVAALNVWVEMNKEREGLSLVGGAFAQRQADREKRSLSATEYAMPGQTS